MNHDNLIKKVFWDYTFNRASSNYRKFNQKMYKYPNVYKYFINRYQDSFSVIESLQRIVFNIEVRPVCKACGKPIEFIGRPNSKGIFRIFCSENCSKQNINFEKCKQTKLERYGDAGFNNQYKNRQTKLERYGNVNYNNPDKIKQTKLERYGDAGYTNREKAKQTKLERYGDEYFFNFEKAKQTKLERYGNSSFVNPDKARKTKKKLYNDETFSNPEKAKQTKLIRYGSETYVNPEKCKQTKLERYGDSKYNNQEKYKQTCLQKYGVSSWSKTKDAKERLSKIISSEEVKIKTYNTKKHNNSFTISKPEDNSYIILVEKYNNVIRQYKSNLYPFACDFYIPEKDLYIECNYSWTHGGKPFNGTIEDNNIVDLWKDKNTKYYNNAIKTWTVRDPLKRETAKKNNLNWIEFFNIDELKLWLEKN